MKTTRTPALAIAGVGLLLLIAGPLLPGGERMTRNDPPRTGHVTDLARADDGSVLAGTQDGELWRLADGAWTRVRVDLGGHPVTALAADLSGDPARGPIGTGGGLVNAPAGLPALNERIGDERATAKGLVVATGNGLRVEIEGAWRKALEGLHTYRLEPQSHGGTDYLHAGTIDRGVFSAAVVDLLDWQPNGQGLPDQTDVFSFGVTAGGRLLAGTDRGLYWQAAPMQPWQPLKIGLEQSRMLSLHLDDADEQGRQRLWIGSDDGLYRVGLTEDVDGVAADAYATLLEAPPDHVRFGISWIVPFDDGIMFSAGSVYRYGPTAMAGWYFVSLGGVLLLLVGGWLFPGRSDQSAGAISEPDSREHHSG
jgi:hypothetical protein